MKKRVLGLFLGIVIIMSISTIFPVCALEEASGTCGDNVTWTLNDAGRLVIRGEGDMTSAPWLTEYKSDITEIKIRDGVTSISQNAFNGCINLVDVDIADTVTTIGGNAFYKCESLTSVYLPESVSTVGGCAFGYCTNLEEINFPDGVTVIRDSMFFRCVNLKEVTLPDTIIDIERLAFYACESLEELQLPEGLETIGREAFAFTTLGDLVIPESVKSITYPAFDYNSYICLNVYAGSYALEYAQQYNKPYVIIEREKTPAEKLCDIINAQTANSCEVNAKSQTVTLLSDVQLSETIAIPTGGSIILQIGDFSILGANDLDAIHVPTDALINIYGSGIIKGGNVTESGYYGGNGISSSGELLISGPTLIGGDALAEYGYAGAGVETCGAAPTYFTEGIIQAGEGCYQKRVMFERLNLTVVKESDDGINYTVAANSFSNNKKYLKAIKISNNLSAASKLSALLNEIQADTCSIVGDVITLNKDFSCPYEIYIPIGDAIILDFNGHTVTTYDFFIPFIIPAQAEITLKGTGVLTNKEQESGATSGMGGNAAVLPNEGQLTIDGITVRGAGLCGINNSGELTVSSGKIIGSDSASGREAIFNSGTIWISGGEIIGGNATRDGGDGGDGIVGRASVSPDGIYPIKLHGGILCGGKGLGDGENGSAISTRFNVGEDCIAYESDDGVNYSVLEGTSCSARYLQIANKSGNAIFTSNIAYDGTNWSCNLHLHSDDAISGIVYAAVYEDKQLKKLTPFSATTQIPVSLACEEEQTIRIFWWDSNLEPKSRTVEIEVQ